MTTEPITIDRVKRARCIDENWRDNVLNCTCC